MKLSIVIPAHNEEKRIGRMLDAYLAYFPEKYGEDVEFIVVVNASTDDTAGFIEVYQEKWPHLHLLVEPRRVGKGGAVRLGFAAAKGDLIGFVDADGATPPHAFDDLVEKIGDDDAVIASRWCKGAKVVIKQTTRRRIASRCFNIVVRVLFGLNISDTQCGAKLIKREALRVVAAQLGVSQWAFDVDLLFQLKRAGFAIRELPSEWHDVRGSSIRLARHGSGMLAALIRLRLLYSPFRGLVKLYRPEIDIFHRYKEDATYKGSERV